MAKEINPQNYGTVVERSEGQLYLMKRCESRSGWAEEVALKLDEGWVKSPDRQSKYMVLIGDVKWFPDKEKSKLSEILKEAEKNARK